MSTDREQQCVELRAEVSRLQELVGAEQGEAVCGLQEQIDAKDQAVGTLRARCSGLEARPNLRSRQGDMLRHDHAHVVVSGLTP